MADQSQSRQPNPTPPTSGEPPSRITPWLEAVGLALLLWAAEKLEQSSALAEPGGSPIPLLSPTAGLALAALVIRGPRLWPGVALGALLQGFSEAMPWVQLIGAVLAQVGESLTAALTLRWFGFRREMARSEDVLRLVGLGAVLGPALGASVGVAGRCLANTSYWANYFSEWWVWWLHDAAGVLIFTPLFLVWRFPVRWRGGRRNWLELILLVAVAFLATHRIFLGNRLFVYMVFPFVIWAALRFSQRGATLVTLLIVVLAGLGTIRQQGPFAITRGPLVRRIEMFETFLGLLAVTGLVLGAVVAERRRATESLRSSETKYRDLVDTLKEVIFQTDAEGCWSYLNPAWEELTGEAVDDALGKPVEHQVLAEDRARYAAAWDELRRGNTGECRLDLRLNAKGNEPRWVALHMRARTDRHSRLLGCSGTLVDTSDQRRAEKQTLALARAVEQAAEIIIILAPDGTIEYANLALERTTSAKRDQLVGQPFDAWLADQSANVSFAAIRDRIQREGVWTGRFRPLTDSGGSLEENTSISAIRDAANAVVGYLAATRDVTKEAALEEQVRLAQKMEAVGLLAGGVAHDFNNLLQIIRGFTELAMDERRTAGDRQASLQQVRNACEKATQLTRQLLAFGRRQSLERTDINLNALVNDHLQLIRRLIGEHITVNFVPGHDLSNVHADRNQLEQVLLNLCVNARDAMPQGGRIVIELSNVLIEDEFLANHPWAKAGRYVLLHVTDNGCGMNKETLNRIFEPFFTTKPKDKGTGLGLSVVYGIIKQHDGLVHVYSEPGVGTSFKIYLPISERKAAGIANRLPARPRRGTETILLAEDEPLVRELATKILERAGYRVLSAADGEEACQIFARHKDHVALALLDVVMPRLGGREAYRKMNEMKPGLPVLFCSGYSEIALQSGFFLDEGTQLISKPYSSEALLVKLQEILGPETEAAAPAAG